MYQRVFLVNLDSIRQFNDYIKCDDIEFKLKHCQNKVNRHHKSIANADLFSAIVTMILSKTKIIILWHFDKPTP